MGTYAYIKDRSATTIDYILSDRSFTKYITEFQVEHAVAVLCSHARYSVLASTEDITIWLVLTFWDIEHQTMLLSKYTLYHDCLRTRT